MDEASAKEIRKTCCASGDAASDSQLLEWLASKMAGTINVRTDGSREPQIAWYFPWNWSLHGPSPLEAIQAAYEADKHRSTSNQ